MQEGYQLLHCGYNELSYFENASFPVILLRTDLTVEYMNLEAESAYGQYFRRPDWDKIYLERDTVRQIKHSLEKGESIVVTPPHVKDFGMLLFQPLAGKDGTPELIRLNVEIFSDFRRKLDTAQISRSLYEFVHNDTRDSMQSMEMAINILKNGDKKESDKPYFSLLENGLTDIKQNIMSFEYIYELMKRHDISKDTLFNPRTDIKQIAENIDGVEYTDLLSDTGMIVYNRESLDITFKTLIRRIQALTGNESVKMKAYEVEPHFVFVISAEKDPDKFSENDHAEELQTAMDIIRFRAEENGGNLIVTETEETVKILYSMRKHLRSEYSMIFNQNQLQF